MARLNLKKLAFGFVITILGGKHLYSQEIKPLSIGDTMPRIVVKNVMNYLESQIDFSNFKNRSIILDFGTTTCIPCVKSLPLLDSLQNEFRKGLQVVFITNENKAVVQKFLERRSKTFSIPVVYQDTILSKYFKHLYIPHEVWINKYGVVVAITDHEYIKRNNVKDLMNNKVKNWVIKWDFPYDYNQPLLMLNKDNLPSFANPSKMSYSVVTSHLEGIAHRSNLLGTLNDSVPSRYYMINNSIYEMYLQAFGRFFSDFPLSKLMLQVSDTSKILYLPQFGYKAEWEEKHTYCYETTQSGQGTEKIVGDLNKYFNMEGKIEHRKVASWILKDFEKKDLLPISRNKGNGLYSISNIIYELNMQWGSFLINESKYKKSELNNFYIPINNLSKNRQALNEILNPYGLEISEAEREVEVFVLTDKTKRSIK